LAAELQARRRKCLIFTNDKQNPDQQFHRFLSIESAKRRVQAQVCENHSLGACTKFGHGLVDGLHSIENACSYGA